MICSSMNNKPDLDYLLVEHFQYLAISFRLGKQKYVRGEGGVTAVKRGMGLVGPFIKNLLY